MGFISTAEALHLINGALKPVECEIPALDPIQRGQTVTDPARFLEEACTELPLVNKEELAGLYAMRASILLRLRGIEKAVMDLDVAIVLSPTSPRVADLRRECARLQSLQQQGRAEEDELESRRGLSRGWRPSRARSSRSRPSRDRGPSRVGSSRGRRPSIGSSRSRPSRGRRPSIGSSRRRTARGRRPTGNGSSRRGRRTRRSSPR